MVGYKHPPQKTQFRKGQSGNPKGRPKRHSPECGGDRSGNAIALREAERLINVREGDSIREMPTIAAIHRARTKAAVSGNAFAQRDAIAHHEMAERERREHIKEECEIWKHYIAVQRKASADAAANGQPPPKELPHPDDVVVDYEKGVRFVGPVSEEAAGRLEKHLKMRDVLIMQYVLDQYLDHKDASEDPLDQHSSAMVLAQVTNMNVPERYRLSDREFATRVMHFEVWTKRVLQKELFGAWKALGVPMRRGKTLPPVRTIKRMYETIGQAWRQLRERLTEP